MRARKPWRRLRILTLGWNVRFTVYSPIPGMLPARAVYRVAIVPVNPWAQGNLLAGPSGSSFI